MTYVCNFSELHSASRHHCTSLVLITTNRLLHMLAYLTFFSISFHEVHTWVIIWAWSNTVFLVLSLQVARDL